MCRLLGYCSRDAASVAELLGTESFRAFTSLSDLHGDGWGMAWYAGSRPATWKSPARAGREPEYDKLAWQPLGDLGLLHLRWATPGLPVIDVNTHPFRTATTRSPTTAPSTRRNGSARCFRRNGSGGWPAPPTASGTSST